MSVERPYEMGMTDVQIVPGANHVYRVDCFSVPDPARAAFDSAMRRNLAFLETLPGFRGHAVLERAGGPGRFNVVTVAAWDSPEAIEEAGGAVRAYYAQIGFDPPGFLAEWGIAAEIGNFAALP